MLGVEAAWALMVKVRQAPSCLLREEMVQPYTESVLAQVGTPPPLPESLGRGTLSFLYKNAKKTPLPGALLASLFAYLLWECLKCLIQSLRFLISHNGRRGPRKQVYLKASLGFSRACTPSPPKC